MTTVLHDALCEGGTRVLGDLLTDVEADVAFNALLPGSGRGEGINYKQCFAFRSDKSLCNLPRAMAFHATPGEDGTTPWYRCTMAQVPQNVAMMSYQPWTPTLQKIKDAAEAAAEETWNLAHVICYRDEKDSMGFHSDTFLDLSPGSKIGVVSLGASREMVMKYKGKHHKRKRKDQTVTLRHNSLVLLDEVSNAKWTHGIRKKRRQEVAGPRVAIVFRNSTTFRSPQGHVFGPRCEFGSLAEAVAYESQAKDDTLAQEKHEQAVERLHLMCRLKNIKEWDGEAMAAFLREEQA